MKCQAAIVEIIGELRTFGAEMLGTDNVGTCKAAIEAIGALRELHGAIDREACRDYEWPAKERAP